MIYIWYYKKYRCNKLGKYKLSGETVCFFLGLHSAWHVMDVNKELLIIKIYLLTRVDTNSFYHPHVRQININLSKATLCLFCSLSCLSST